MRRGFSQKFRRTAAAGLLAAWCLMGSASAAADTLPILMYHDLTIDENDTDSMTVTDERFRLDMEFLQEFGFTPLLSEDLLAIRQGSAAMPEKPVVITFDDGYRANYDIAYPILQQTGMRAIIAVVAHNIRAAEQASQTRSSMTWEELREMVSTGTVEVGSHTYNLHNASYGGNLSPDGIDGVTRRPGETESAYRQRVGGDLQKSIELIRQYTGQARVWYFSYPFGAYDPWMETLLEESGIYVSTLTYGDMANISWSLQKMPRYGIRMDNPVSGLLRQTDTAVPVQAEVSVNGQAHTLAAYNIDGNNYVRVRDVAALLKDTASGFDVQWNEGLFQVELASFTPYTPLGTENAPLPAGGRTVQSILEPTAADGTLHMVAAYNIDGCTFYKLRSLSELCGFTVGWDEQAQAVQVTA